MSELEDPKIREELEGFLGNVFNGVIFLLREPNTENADSFWFKNCLNNTIPEGKDEKAYKGNFDKYKKKFETMLKYIGASAKLNQAAYFNLRPGSGGAEKTHAYDFHLRNRDYVAHRFDAILDYCKPKAKDKCLYVFTCSDILDALLKNRPQNQILKTYPYEMLEEQKKGGVLFSYGRESHRRILCKTNDGFQITIFEIHHPSARSEVITPKGE